MKRIVIVRGIPEEGFVISDLLLLRGLTNDWRNGIFETRNWIEMEEWINSEWKSGTRAFC